MSTHGVQVVVTAMALSESARARLSELLGPDFMVVDITRAPESADLVLAPLVSDRAVSILRRQFPRARILTAELVDAEYKVSFDGPIRQALQRDTDGYVVANSIAAVSDSLRGQAALQLEGDRRRTAPELSPNGERPAPGSDATAGRAGASEASGKVSVVWLNGPFGVGKTTTARLLVERHGWRIFDPELTGLYLRHLITEPVHDFQSWPAWRALVAETVVQLVEHYDEPVVCPISLLNRQWASEIFAAVDLAGLGQRHVVLHADSDTLRDRLTHDVDEPTAVNWRLGAIERYNAAQSWLREQAKFIDSSRRTPDEVADLVTQELHPAS